MKKNYQNESGRSMVEMLGVLAVIGVLSVAGIAGYTNAMNKHRANELLNEASKRATFVAAQISMQGKNADTVSIAEFTNPSGYEFKVAKKNANQFNITIDTVDNDICTQIKTAVGTNTPIRKINDACTELTYNNDMSTTVWASDYEDSTSCNNAHLRWCILANGKGKCTSSDNCLSIVDSDCNVIHWTNNNRLLATNESENCSSESVPNGICVVGTCTPKTDIYKEGLIIGSYQDFLNKATSGHSDDLCPSGYMWMGLSSLTADLGTNDKPCAKSGDSCDIPLSGAIMTATTCQTECVYSNSAYVIYNGVLTDMPKNIAVTKPLCRKNGG